MDIRRIRRERSGLAGVVRVHGVVQKRGLHVPLMSTATDHGQKLRREPTGIALAARQGVRGAGWSPWAQEADREHCFDLPVGFDDRVRHDGVGTLAIRAPERDHAALGSFFSEHQTLQRNERLRFLGGDQLVIPAAVDFGGIEIRVRVIDPDLSHLAIRFGHDQVQVLECLAKPFDLRPVDFSLHGVASSSGGLGLCKTHCRISYSVCSVSRSTSISTGFRKAAATPVSRAASM